MLPNYTEAHNSIVFCESMKYLDLNKLEKRNLVAQMNQISSQSV